MKLLVFPLVVAVLVVHAPAAQTVAEVEATLDTLFVMSGPLVDAPTALPTAVARARSSPAPYVEGLRAYRGRVLTEVEEPRRFQLIGRLSLTASLIGGAEAEAFVGEAVDYLVDRGVAVSGEAIAAKSAFDEGALDLPAFRAATAPAEAVAAALVKAAWAVPTFQSAPLVQRVAWALAGPATGSSPDAPVHESIVAASRAALESFGPLLPSAQEVRPRVLCVVGDGDTRVALFGYDHEGGEISTVPHGPENEVDGTFISDLRPPTVFGQSTPSRDPLSFYALAIPFRSTESATWTVLGRTATATLESAGCDDDNPSEPPPVDEDADVRPVLECVAAHPDGTYTAYFGYDNRHGAPVSIPAGRRNRLTPQRHDGPQPTAFDVPGVVPGEPGRTDPYPGFAVAVEFDRGAVVWHLGGRTATANRGRSRRCPTD